MPSGTAGPGKVGASRPVSGSAVRATRALRAELPQWDATTTGGRPLSMYDSLKDSSLAHYFGKAVTRRFLVDTGIIATDGRIVHLSRSFGRAMIASQKFATSERDEEARVAQEHHLRKQLIARTAASKTQLLKDTRVHTLWMSERQLLERRKEASKALQEKSLKGQGARPPTKDSVQRSYAMEWKRVAQVPTERVIVKTTVRAASASSSSSNVSATTASSTPRRGASASSASASASASSRHGRGDDALD